MRFADIIGQEELKGHLQNALQNQKVSHAYIISGEEGSGKRMLAEAFAQTLLCEEKGGRLRTLPSLPADHESQSAGYYLPDP